MSFHEQETNSLKRRTRKEEYEFNQILIK